MLSGSCELVNTFLFLVIYLKTDDKMHRSRVEILLYITVPVELHTEAVRISTLLLISLALWASQQ